MVDDILTWFKTRFGAVIAEYALREELAKMFDEKDQQRSMALGLNGFNFNTRPTPYR